MPDDLDDVIGPAHQFAPLESPRSGLRVALAGIRAQISQLTKYADALERDLASLEAAQDNVRATVPAPAGEVVKSPTKPRSAPQEGPKAWRSR